MRVGKKANVVEAKKTRSCVVRLEKVSSPPIKVTRSSGGSSRAHVQLHSEEKKTKAPIKKRPVSQGQNTSGYSMSGTTNAAHSSAKSKNAKEKFKTPPKAKIIPVKTPVVIPEPTETLASGRSRRAIKPNPKYASEDMVTPKMIRNVATSGSTAKKSSAAPTEKSRKPSTSSLDDFFNRDSNDDSTANDLEDELDKMYKAIDRDSDSDFSDISKSFDNKRKVKPRKSAPSTATTTATPASAPRPTNTNAHKAQTSQLQLLRKSFAASVNRSMDPTAGIKRGRNESNEPTAGIKRGRNDLNEPMANIKRGRTESIEPMAGTKRSRNDSIDPMAGIKRGRNDSITLAGSSDNDADSASVARKRLLLSKSSTVGRENKNSISSNVSMIIRKTNQPINGSQKIMKLKTDIRPIDDPKRNTKIIEKRTLMDGNNLGMKMFQQNKLPTLRNISINNNSTSTGTAATSATSATTTTRTLITMPIKTQNIRGLTATKRRSASPATTATPKSSIKPIKEENPTKLMKEEKPQESVVEKKLPEAPPITVDDFETMPTFTIVNINDIINKKGDVLISKSDVSQTKTDDSDIADTEPPEKIKPKEYMHGPGRRKGLLTNKVSDFMRSQSPLTTTKNPAQKILNHALVKKSSPPTSAALRNKLNSSISPDKPAPRILNSMVAKKTQPVKPMIANFDDSADEDTYQLSLDGEDEDMDADDDDENDTGGITDDFDDDDDDDDDADDSFEISKHKTSTPYPTKNRIAPTASTKENSQKALNRQQPNTIKSLEQRKVSPEKVVISRQGDKVIKKITCFETWYVIIPKETPPKVTRNMLDIPLIKLANVATDIKLPNGDWKSKVTLHELSPTMIAKSNLTAYTGDLREYNIAESDRGRYQPSCVMFRRSVNDRAKSRLPYDRAVIFKNRTFFTNIEGKNVKLVGAPSTIHSPKDVEILLQIVDSLTLQSSFVEPTNTMQ